MQGSVAAVQPAALRGIVAFGCGLFYSDKGSLRQADGP